MLGCYKLRAVPINVNYRYVDDELAYLLDDADAALVVHDEPVRERATRVAGSRARTRRRRPGASTQRSPRRPRPATSARVRATTTTCSTPAARPACRRAWCGARKTSSSARSAAGIPAARRSPTPEEIAESVRDNPAQRLRAFLPAGDPGPEQFVSLALGPLMHASGQWSALGTLLGGGKVVLYDRPHVDMEHVLDLVERERVNAMNLVGDASARPLLDALAREPGRWDTSSLLLLGSGGSILSGDVKDALMDALPSVLAIVEGIGSSESPAQAVAVTTRAGAPAPSLTFAAKAETMVVDDELRPIPRGQGIVGRLATRGRVPLGYYKDPDRSARTFVEIDGERWSLPGDMATIDADGTVHLLGRGSLCINTGGEKVYPEEVEAVVKTHPAVARRGRRRRARYEVRRTGRRDRGTADRTTHRSKRSRITAAPTLPATRSPAR